MTKEKEECICCTLAPQWAAISSKGAFWNFSTTCLLRSRSCSSIPTLSTRGRHTTSIKWSDILNKWGRIKIIIVLSYRWHFSEFQTWSPLLVSSGKVQAKTLGNNSSCLNKIHYIKWDPAFLPPLFLGCFWTPPLPAVRWSLLYSSSWTNGPHLLTDHTVCKLPQLRARWRL